MPEFISIIPALSIFSISRTLSLVLLAVALVWIFWRSVKGREVERRIIFLFVAVAVALPLLFEITFEINATPIVKTAFQKVESLPSGSTILLSFDYDPAVAPEVGPMSVAFLRHCLVKGHKVVCMSLWVTGQSLMNRTVAEITSNEFPDKVDGVDWVNIGYKAGNEGVLNVIVTDIKKMFPTDINGIPYDSLEIFDGISSCADFDLVLVVGSGQPGAKEWVLFVGDVAGVPLAAGVSAVSAPQLYPYFPGQLLGLLGGIKGAAEYESELIKNYPQFADMSTPAIRMMGPQTVAHVVIIMFIIMGNISFFRKRRDQAS